MTRSTRIWLAGLFLILTVLVYGGHVRTATFVHEDLVYLNGAIYGADTRPLTYATWRWLTDPVAAHAVNVGLHLVNAVLVWVLLRRIGVAEWATWGAVGAYFLLHRLAVESVAYATGRAELLAGLAVLTAAIIAAGPRTGPLAWLGMLAALAIGYQAKESAAVGLLLLPLLVRGYFSRVVAWGLAGVTLLAIWDRAQTIQSPDAVMPYADWIAIQATATMRLMANAILPLVNTVDYDYDAVSGMTRLVAVGCVGVLAGLPLLARDRIARIALAWPLVVLLPRFLVRTPRSYLNEHQFYLALVGVTIGVGYALSRGLKEPYGEVESCAAA